MFHGTSFPDLHSAKYTYTRGSRHHAIYCLLYIPQMIPLLFSCSAYNSPVIVKIAYRAMLRRFISLAKFVGISPFDPSMNQICQCDYSGTGVTQETKKMLRDREHHPVVLGIVLTCVQNYETRHNHKNHGDKDSQ